MPAYLSGMRVPFTDEMKEGADKFFSALMKLDAANVGKVENSAPVIDTPAPVASTVEDTKTTEEPTADTSKPNNNATDANEMAELKASVEALRKELASVKVNLNSTLEANTLLADKLATILRVPENTVKVENSRPAPKEPFADWQTVIDAKLNRKS